MYVLGQLVCAFKQDTLIKRHFSGCKVSSSRLSWLVAHARIFRLFMKGKFDTYELWHLAKRVQNLKVDWSTACNFTVCTLENQLYFFAKLFWSSVHSVILPWGYIRGCYYFLYICCCYRFSSLRFSSLMFNWCGCYEIKSNISKFN